MIQNWNVYCFKVYYSSYNTFSKVQIQNSNNKDFSYFKKPQPKNLKLALLYNNAVKSAKKKNRKDKKKKFQKQR